MRSYSRVYAKRVARGMARLDKRIPGWRAQVNERRLVMWRQNDCVLGQVTGNYMRGLRKLGIGPARGIRYGFDVFSLSPPSRQTKSARRKYAALELEWKAALLQSKDMDREINQLIHIQSHFERR